MKKFLLVATAMLISMSGMAKRSDATPMSKSLGMKLPKMVNASVFKSVAEKYAAQTMFYSGMEQNKRPVLKAAKKAEDVSFDELMPTYAVANYVYSDLLGAVYKPLYDGASFLVKDGKAYMSFFTDIDYVEGVIEKGDNAFKAQYGADSITFTVVTENSVAGDKAGNKYYMGLATYDGTTGSLVRNSKKTIGAYYFAEAQEIYVPLYSLDDFVCLFAENATEPELGYIVANIDVIPQSILNARISKGSYKATNTSGKTLSGDVEIMLYGSYYVRGFNPVPSIKDEWVEFSISKDDENMAIVDEDQLMGQFEYYLDETYTETAPVAFTPVGAYSDFSNFTEDGSSSYFVTDDEITETTTIESTGMDMYGIYGYSMNSDLAGPWAWISDLSINITYEPAYAGISNATLTKATSTEYFDLQGRKVNGKQKGLLIKKSTLSDGTVKSVKMLNK